VQREGLREHLKTCGPCRSHYDSTALAMRRMLGSPDEMTEEELWLFEPPLPAAQVVPLFRPGRAVALALAATLAGVVIWYSTSRPDEFGARGGPKVVLAPSARALCMRGPQVMRTCSEGDTLLFVASPRGLTHVKLLDDGKLVGEGDVADAPETPLPWTLPFRPGIQPSVHLSKCATCEETAVKAAP
jgi:hypothetical protein